MKALVTDVELRNAVAGVRALGRGGIEVVAAAAVRAAAGFRSRYVVAQSRVPSVLADPVAFAQEVARIAEQHAPLVVYPGREESLDALLDARTMLPAGAVLPYPASENVRALRRKPDLATLSRDVGLLAPKTLALATASEISRRPPAFPCVVKEVEPGGAVTLPAVIRSRSDLISFLDRLPDDQPLIAQEVAVGPLISLSLVLTRTGRPVAQFQQVALRTWPSSAGGTSLGKSVELDPDLARRATTLLSRHAYWGLAQLQFVGTSTGSVLIDINPRFYGTLPLALASGVNLPALWHAVATREEHEIPEPAPYRVGVTYRWLEADISAALQGHPSRLLPLRRPGGAGAIWDSADPRASVLLATHAMTERLRRVAARRHAARTPRRPEAGR